MWMTPSEELKQGVKGLALHFCEALAVVMTAYAVGAQWQAWAIGMILFGITWETGMFYGTRRGGIFRWFTQRTWNASFCGMVAFHIGAIAAGLVIVLWGK